MNYLLPQLQAIKYVYKDKLHNLKLDKKKKY